MAVQMSSYGKDTLPTQPFHLTTLLSLFLFRREPYTCTTMSPPNLNKHVDFLHLGPFSMVKPSGYRPHTPRYHYRFPHSERLNYYRAPHHHPAFPWSRHGSCYSNYVRLGKYASRLYCNRIHYHPANILWIHRIQKNRLQMDYQPYQTILAYPSGNVALVKSDQTWHRSRRNHSQHYPLTWPYHSWIYTGIRHFTSNFIQQLLHNHSGYFTQHRYHLSKTMVYPHQTRKGAESLWHPWWILGLI